LRDLLATTRARAKDLDAIYPPASTELQLYVGLLAAYSGDLKLLDEALRGVRDNTGVRDYPTVAQLQEVVLAEQERLAGNPRAAVARLSPLVRQDTALVAVHWALMRAEQAAGNLQAASEQSRWLVTHRGRIFVENTTTDVLRFFNAAVGVQARSDASVASRATPSKEVPATPAR
jgi:hypothetical protein